MGQNIFQMKSNFTLTLRSIRPEEILWKFSKLYILNKYFTLAVITLCDVLGDFSYRAWLLKNREHDVIVFLQEDAGRFLTTFYFTVDEILVTNVALCIQSHFRMWGILII